MSTATVDEKTTLHEQIGNALQLFVEEVALSSDLEIIGTATPKAEEVFVLRDHSKEEGIEGAYVEVAISEIVKKATDYDKAMEFVSVIENKRAPIVLNGVTRIVGYYSRVNNWNKSKVGELRDRAKGNYGTPGVKPKFQDDRMKTVNSL